MHQTGGDDVGGNKVGQDSLSASIGDDARNVIAGSKEAQQVIINEHAADALDALRHQLNRVEDNIYWKLSLVERDISNLKIWVLVLTISTTLLFLAFTAVIILATIQLPRNAKMPMAPSGLVESKK